MARSFFSETFTKFNTTRRIKLVRVEGLLDTIRLEGRHPKVCVALFLAKRQLLKNGAYEQQVPTVNSRAHLLCLGLKFPAPALFQNSS